MAFKKFTLFIIIIFFSFNSFSQSIENYLTKTNNIILKSKINGPVLVFETTSDYYIYFGKKEFLRAFRKLNKESAIEIEKQSLDTIPINKYYERTNMVLAIDNMIAKGSAQIVSRIDKMVVKTVSRRYVYSRKKLRTIKISSAYMDLSNSKYLFQYNSPSARPQGKMF